MIDLDKAKTYLRVEYDDDDEYIKELIEVAYTYIREGITGYDTKINHPAFEQKADMVARAIIQNLYDERYLMGRPLEMSYMIRAMMLQMEVGDYVQPRTQQDAN